MNTQQQAVVDRHLTNRCANPSADGRSCHCTTEYAPARSEHDAYLQRLGRWTESNAELVMQALRQHGEDLLRAVHDLEPEFQKTVAAQLLAANAEVWAQMADDLDDLYNGAVLDY